MLKSIKNTIILATAITVAVTLMTPAILITGANAAPITKTKQVFDDTQALASWEVENADGTITRTSILVQQYDKKSDLASVEFWSDVYNPDDPEGFPIESTFGYAVIPENGLEIANDLSSVTLDPLTITTCDYDIWTGQCIPDTEETHTIEAQWTATEEPQVTSSFEQKSKTIYQGERVAIKTTSEYVSADAVATASLDGVDLGDSTFAVIVSGNGLYSEKVKQK